jgi:hypothetical protein
LRNSTLAICCALLAAGCGGGGGGGEPSLPSDLAEQLAARSDSAAARLEAGEFCAARADATTLQSRTIAAINSGRVPAELQEELLGSVNALLEAISCTPPTADDGAAEDARALAEWLRDRS